MEITVSGLQVTTLLGPLGDQAQLIGVVNTLYEMHFPILAVEMLVCGRGSTSPRRNTP